MGMLQVTLSAFGGGNTPLQEYHHLLVDTYYWISNNQFADLYALTEAAPGPSSIIVWPNGSTHCRSSLACLSCFIHCMWFYVIQR